ncbi:CDK-activating kinase assembly factor MAT1-like protein [Leptotrombidium deliense]|uniref:CDK-activating kinase assembly factor MAT1 n=1 Tax=Leptotrombidium deliense TaxID=299467 RepID=A0A443SN03_9ACAR|nr:CDK-activating kinase assembly factor MAT1-like protein [Leptotrombidium deliense]
MEDDVSCPRCKTTRYRNPSLKLYVNVCGHPLCDNCIDLLFVKGSGNCNQCGINLRRTNFRLQLFEDSYIEKEVDIRKRILKDYNKLEDDFESLDDYNNYLEEVETIIYNLANNIDVDSTKRKVEQYKKENQEQIMKNRAKISKDTELIEELLEKETAYSSWRMKVVANEDTESSKAKIRRKEELVDDLMYSDAPASQILMNHERKIKSQESDQQPKQMPPKPASYFSTGIKVGKGSNTFAPLPTVPESEPFKYVSSNLDFMGPKCPEYDELESDGYLLHIRNVDPREKAGGFLPQYPCLRALQESFCGLYCKLDENKT